jgi:hypothetical protein
MPKWVSVFEYTPILNSNYFVKINGKKGLLHLDEFNRVLGRCETFFWLDESDEDKKNLDLLIGVKSIDEFVKMDRRMVSEQLLTKYNPMIHKSIVMNQFHKYYLKIIADLRKRISQQGVKSPTIHFKNAIPVDKKRQSLLDRIKLLNDNPFI